MNIRTKAALYTIGYFVGIFVLGVAIHAIMPYVELWMCLIAIFGIMFYCMYSLMLTGLQFDASITKVQNKEDKPKAELLQE